MSPPNETDADRHRSPAIAKAAAIMQAIADERGGALGISELSRRVGVAKSSVAAICDTLVSVELLARSEHGYQLGRKLGELGGVYLRSTDLVDAFARAAPRAARALDQTVQLAVLRDDLDVVYLAREYANQPIQVASELGQPLPANCTGAGKALLGALDPEELDRRLADVTALPGLTERSITDVDELRAETARIREDGYATDDDETITGVYCVAVAPPQIPPSIQAFAVSCTFLQARRPPLPTADIVATLTALGDEILRELGVARPEVPTRRAAGA